MRRFLPTLAAPLVLAALVGAVVGGKGIAIGSVLLLGSAGLWWLLGANRRTVDVGWARTGGLGHLEAGVAATTPIGVNARRLRSTRGSVSASLARVEARELVASPWFGLGVGFWLIVLVAFGVAFEDDNERGWWFFFGLSSMLANPFAGMVVVGVHRNATRDRRDGCDELFDACPADAGARSLGLLLTAWLPALVSAAFLAVLAAMVAAGNPRMFGPVDHEAAAALLTVAVLGGGAVALGVTLARWAPGALAPILAVVAVGIVDVGLNGIGRPSWSTDRLLSTALAPPDVDLLFTTRPVWPRVLWLSALSVLVGTLAFVRDRRSPVPRLVAAGSVVVAIIAAVLVVQPGSGSQVGDIAELVADPPAHQRCRWAGTDVRVCAYRPYADAAAIVARELGPVADAVPSGVLDGVTFRQRSGQALVQFQAEVAERIRGGRLAAPASELLLRFNLHPENVRAARLRLGARAVGLPTEAGDGGRPLVVAGQSRGVVALWLATRGLDLGAARDLVADGRSDRADATDIGSIWPGICHEEAASLVWAPRDLVATRLLLALPAGRMQTVVDRHWDNVIDATATTDDLLALLGLRLPGVPEAVQPRPSTC